MSVNRTTRAQLKKKDKNNCVCHFCRKSENRKRSVKVKYYPCSLCNKTYCKPCTLENPKIMPDIYGCLYCQGLCCCLKKCREDHKCCYNSKRSHKRRDKKDENNLLKRKYDQIHGTYLSKFIDILEPEFKIFKEDPIHIYYPVPIRVVPVF